MEPISFYKCLADETRLKTLLLIADKTSLCVCDLVDALELSQPKISRHLAELRQCKVLSGERRGKWVHYTLHPQLPLWAQDIIHLTLKNNPAYIQPQLTKLTQIASCCE